MGARSLSVLLALAITASASAKDVYLSVGGSAGNFRTDARLFNPSTTKDIQIQAWYLPRGNGDNTAVQPLTITVKKRQMAVYDDVVSSLFHGTDLGAIRFSSVDDFVATQRIYAQTPNGTLGQFVPGLDASSAKKNGVLIQLKSGSAFRTNIGMVNPNAAAATITWRLYDKDNALVATGTPMTMPPFAVVGPTNMASTFFFTPGTADLSDAWVSYASDQPIFAYASVIDNATTDPTFIPMSEDSGATTSAPPPAPTTQTFDVTLRSFLIDMTPDPSTLKPGDQATFRVRAIDSGHGFTLLGPDGRIVIADRSSAYPVGQAFDYTFTAAGGTYSYFCTHPTCGFGHNEMSGSFTVGNSSDPGSKYSTSAVPQHHHGE